MILLILSFISISWADSKNLILAVDIIGGINTHDVLVEIQPTPGHHFNLKAPTMFGNKMNATQNQEKNILQNLTETKMTWKIVEPGASHAYEVVVYVCDDAGTFCQKQTQEVSWTTQPRINGPKMASFVAITKESTSTNPSQYLGFILNDVQKAREIAKKSGKPILIDFFAIWCPPCNQLDEDVFSTQAFKDFQKKYVLLKLDADSESSFSLKSKYKISGYPTVVFTNSEFDEITRLVGFYSIDEFKKTSALVLQNSKNGFESLQKTADLGDVRARNLLGLIYLERKEYSQATKYLNGSLSPPKGFKDRYYEAEIELAKQKENWDQALAFIKKLENEFPNSLVEFYRLSDRIEILEKLKKEDELKEARLCLIKSGRSLLGLSKISVLDRGDILSSIAENTEILKDAVAAKEIWRESSKELKKGFKTGFERGISLEYGYALWKSGDLAGAEKLYSKMIKKFPMEFTFYYALGSMWLKNQKPELALQKFNDAFLFSYGDHRLRVALNKAKALKELSKTDVTKKQVALNFLNEVIQSVPVPSDTGVRTGKYLEQLIAFKKELE